MKKTNWWKWGVILLVAIFLFPLLLMQISPDFAARVERDKAKKDSESQIKATQDRLVKSEENYEDKDAKVLGEVKSALARSGLTLCGVYQWIGDSELKINRGLEAKHGVAAAMKMVDERDRAYGKAWDSYRKKHNIPDSLRTYINVFGIKECL